MAGNIRSRKISDRELILVVCAWDIPALAWPRVLPYRVEFGCIRPGPATYKPPARPNPTAPGRGSRHVNPRLRTQKRNRIKAHRRTPYPHSAVGNRDTGRDTAASTTRNHCNTTISNADHVIMNQSPPRAMGPTVRPSGMTSAWNRRCGCDAIVRQATGLSIRCSPAAVARQRRAGPLQGDPGGSAPTARQQDRIAGNKRRSRATAGHVCDHCFRSPYPIPVPPAHHSGVRVAPPSRSLHHCAIGAPLEKQQGALSAPCFSFGAA
jgi:hypothetical protein